MRLIFRSVKPKLSSHAVVLKAEKKAGATRAGRRNSLVTPTFGISSSVYFFSLFIFTDVTCSSFVAAFS